MWLASHPHHIAHSTTHHHHITPHTPQGHRKPEAAAYAAVEAALATPPASLLFVDDRKANVEAARARGWGALHFSDAASLEAELRARGLEF